MEPGKIVFQGKTKDNQDISIRYCTKEDSQAMYEYINTISQEKTFITFQGEQVTLEEETHYVASEVQKIEESQAVQLLAFCSNQLVGISGIDLRSKAEKHIGVFGLSVAKDFRGIGVGSLLMSQVISEAEARLTELKIIILGVFGDNTVARKMYEKFGFKDYGCLPNGILHDGIPVDHLYMYKNVDR